MQPEAVPWDEISISHEEMPSKIENSRTRVHMRRERANLARRRHTLNRHGEASNGSGTIFRLQDRDDKPGDGDDNDDDDNDDGGKDLKGTLPTNGPVKSPSGPLPTRNPVLAPSPASSNTTPPLKTSSMPDSRSSSSHLAVTSASNALPWSENIPLLNTIGTSVTDYHPYADNDPYYSSDGSYSTSVNSSPRLSLRLGSNTITSALPTTQTTLPSPGFESSRVSTITSASATSIPPNIESVVTNSPKRKGEIAGGVIGKIQSYAAL
jgi:hypothetical protein